MTLDSSSEAVDFLVLGAGWSWQFLHVQLEAAKLSYAITTRDGRTIDGDRSHTLSFDASRDRDELKQQFAALPDAKTVLITFPIYGKGGSKLLLDLFAETHEQSKAAFIQLGSSGIWNGGPTLQDEKKSSHWTTRHSSFDRTNPRATAETELLSLSSDRIPTTVLNLSGLWGGERSVKHFAPRVAGSYEQLKSKTSIHMIHGEDVAQIVLAVHSQWSKAAGQRWLVTDLRVYDWYELASKYLPKETGVWVNQFMDEQNIRALPRTPEELGRCLDSRELWQTFGISPRRAGLE